MAFRPTALLGALGLFVTAQARAQDLRVRLEYLAPDGCPGAAEFQREVERRLERGRIAGSEELLRTYRVSVTTSEAGARAMLEFTDVDGAKASREVTGATCAEAVTAMALITALAIEARVAEDQKERPPAALPTPPPAVTPAPPPAAREIPALPLRRGPPLVLGFGALAGVERGYAPELAPAVAAVVELLHGPHTLRALVQYSDTGPVEVDGGSAELWLLSLRLEGCPTRLPLGGSASFVPCAALEGGVVHAEGERSPRIAHPESVSLPWLAAHAVARLELSPDPGLAFGAQGALGLPFIRHELVLEKPDARVHEVPAVSWGAGASMLARFR